MKPTSTLDRLSDWASKPQGARPRNYTRRPECSIPKEHLAAFTERLSERIAGMNSLGGMGIRPNKHSVRKLAKDVAKDTIRMAMRGRRG